MIEPLESLHDLRRMHDVQISVLQAAEPEGLKCAEIQIGEKSWVILVDDEYDDLIQERQLMCFFLVLRELEIYQSESDFLRWCSQNGWDPKDSKLLYYYKQLGKTVLEIESIIGEIDSKISGLDYELRTGVIDELVAAK